MKSPDEKHALLQAARATVRLLRANPIVTEWRIATPRLSRIEDTETAGWSVDMGSLTPLRASMSLWLCRFAGHPTRKFWFGFTSYGRKSIQVIKQAIQANGYRRSIPHLGLANVRDQPGDFLRLKVPLPQRYFDRVLHEEYDGDYYLGVFPDPRVRSTRVLAAATANFLALGCRAAASEGLRPSRRRGKRARGSAEHNRKVEKAAVNAVTALLRQRGYKIRSREKEGRGYDLDAAHPRRGLEHVEVKGTSDPRGRFSLSFQEYHAASDDPLWRLAVVTNALSAPRVRSFSAAQMRRAFAIEPVEWAGYELAISR